MRLQLTISTLLMFWVGAAWSAPTRTLEADTINSSNLARTYNLPAQSGTSTLMVSAGLIQETPSGTINGTNVTFTLSVTPVAAATINCTIDGLIMTQGTGRDYTISGATLTLNEAPVTGQVLWCQYSRF